MLRPPGGSGDENVITRPLLVVTTVGTGDTWSLSGTGWTTVDLPKSPHQEEQAKEIVEVQQL